MKNSQLFSHKRFALMLVFPQLLITIIFFIWPALQAVRQSLYQEDPFGIHKVYVGLQHFVRLFTSPSYLETIYNTATFSLSVTLLTLISGLVMALLVNSVRMAKGLYKSLLIWPYAVAPAVAGILWRFIFNPSVGWVSYLFQYFGWDWNYIIYPKQAFWIVVLTSSWQQFSYNFLFYFAALQAIPKSLLEAATIDGANAWQKFYHITLPLLSPTTFFLIVINVIYAFFDTFGIIQVMTQGGPAGQTTTLVYKVYNDGFLGLDFGGSAAQSVVLMIIISILMLVQFKYIDNKVHY